MPGSIKILSQASFFCRLNKALHCLVFTTFRPLIKLSGSLQKIDLLKSFKTERIVFFKMEQFIEMLSMIIVSFSLFLSIFLLFSISLFVLTGFLIILPGSFLLLYPLKASQLLRLLFIEHHYRNEVLIHKVQA